jgi:RNA polymerase sigma factor (sigma-70 family)
MTPATLASPATAPTRPAGDTDQDLIARVRAGDDTAFAVLYQRYHRRIAAYIYGMVKDFGRAEDIAQDVFMSALRRMRDTDREIAFKPWIYEIAKNACIDQFRRARRSEEVSYDADEGMGPNDHGRLVSIGPTPDVAVDQKLALDNLRGAFGGLSQTHHEILVMREFEGLSYREIGARLGMSRPSVESTLFRARRRLAEEYEELVSGARCVRVQEIIVGAETGSLGTRDRRKLAAHVSHCQACRRHALVAGIDPALLRGPRPVRAKIAALLPVPLFLRRRLGDADPSVVVPPHSAQVAQWSTQLSSFADPAVAGWTKAVAAAAAVAVAAAGIGAEVATVERDGASPRPAASAPTVKRTPVRPTGVRRVASAPLPAAPKRTAPARSLPAGPVQRDARTRVDTVTPKPPDAAASNAGKSNAPAGPGTAGDPTHLLGPDGLLPGVEPPAQADPAKAPIKVAVAVIVRDIVQESRRTAAPPLRRVVDQAAVTAGEARTSVDQIIHGG